MDRQRGRVEPVPVQGLATLNDLFQCLHAEGVPYCHWKSNDHLAASMTGATDLDLLVARDAAVQLARLLGERGFKRFMGKPGRGYPGIEDYVGFDSATGRLVHLEIHYQLTLGEKFLKGYRLPWEGLLLSTRQLDQEHGIYVADPHMELLMVVMRAVMKLRTRDLVLTALGRPYTARSALHELPWLRARVREERLLATAGRLVGPAAARMLADLVASPRPTLTQLLAFGRCVRPRLSEYRTYGSLEARLRRWIGEWRAVWGTLERVIRRGPGRAKRLPQGGLLVAFVGAEGSGKSSLTRALAGWLSREAALLATYGDGGPRLRAMGRSLGALGLARARHRQAVAARRARNRGLIVICDRWPQDQERAADEAPVEVSRAPVRRAAASYELATRRAAELDPPDLVLKLHVSSAVAVQRIPGLSAGRLRQEAEIVRQLQYPPGTRVVEIDADRPFDEVLLRAKQALWQAM